MREKTSADKQIEIYNLKIRGSRDRNHYINLW